jgi:hypothetical protein
VCSLGLRADVASAVKEHGIRGGARKLGLTHTSVIRHLSPEHQARINGTPLPGKAKPVVEVPKHETEADIVDKVALLSHDEVIAAFKTFAQRRSYLESLMIANRFNNASTSMRLETTWNVTREEMACLVAQAAEQVQYARGTVQARRLRILNNQERLAKKAEKDGDYKTAAKIWMDIAKVDDVTGGNDWQAGLLNSPAWRVCAQILQQFHPDAFTRVHAELAAVNDQTTRALAPYSIAAESGTE